MQKHRRPHKNVTQEITHQLFGCPHRPIKHLGKKLVRGSINVTNNIVNELFSSMFGFGQPSKRRRRRR